MLLRLMSSLSMIDVKPHHLYICTQRDKDTFIDKRNGIRIRKDIYTYTHVGMAFVRDNGELFELTV